MGPVFLSETGWTVKKEQDRCACWLVSGRYSQEDRGKGCVVPVVPYTWIGTNLWNKACAHLLQVRTKKRLCGPQDYMNVRAGGLMVPFIGPLNNQTNCKLLGRKFHYFWLSTTLLWIAQKNCTQKSKPWYISGTSWYISVRVDVSPFEAGFDASLQRCLAFQCTSPQTSVPGQLVSSSSSFPVTDMLWDFLWWLQFENDYIIDCTLSIPR